jgi:hypothetical protein
MIEYITTIIPFLDDGTETHLLAMSEIWKAFAALSSYVTESQRELGIHLAGET